MWFISLWGAAAKEIKLLKSGNLDINSIFSQKHYEQWRVCEIAMGVRGFKGCSQGDSHPGVKP